jgi:hypothetical protein
MNTSLVTTLQELLGTGEILIPQGGSEFSGYNAKRQSQYLLWRKKCLDAIGVLREKGTVLFSRIANDENGMYFYQSSAQTIASVVTEALSIAQAAHESEIAEAAVAPIIEPTFEPIAKPTPEPETAMAAVALSEPTLEPIAEPTPGPEVTDAAVEPAEPIAEPMPEPEIAEAALATPERLPGHVDNATEADPAVITADTPDVDEAGPDPVSEAAAIEPAVAEAITAEPIVYEAAAGEPAVAEAITAEPIVSEAAAVEPAVAEAITAEPIVSEPIPAEDNVPEAAVLEPAAADAIVSEPDHGKVETGSERWAEITPIVMFSSSTHPVLGRLQNYFRDLSIDCTLFTHTNGTWELLASLNDRRPLPRYAVFLLSEEYRDEELLALGYLAGKYPWLTLSCIHHQTQPLPTLLPGMSSTEFIHPLDEIKIGVMKELKSAGYSVSL